MLDGVARASHALHVIARPVAAARVADAVPMIPVRVLHSRRLCQTPAPQAQLIGHQAWVLAFVQQNLVTPS